MLAAWETYGLERDVARPGLEDGDERHGKEKVKQREGRSLRDDTGWSI